LININYKLLACAGLLSILAFAPVKGQVSPFTTVARVSVAPRIKDGTSNTIATIGQAKDGSTAVIVRSFDRSTGFQQGSPLVLMGDGSVRFKDVLVSNIQLGLPGTVLALDSLRRVRIFPLGFRTDGTPFLAAPSRVIGPLGPSGAGEGTVIGETLVVNREAPTPISIIAIGTANGEVVLAANNGDGILEPVCTPISSGPIQDLGPITQAGYFALGAVSGGKLFLINPDDDPAMAGLQPRLVADLRDPRRIPLIDFGSPTLTRDSLPFIDPLTNLIVTANGTTEIATLEIPANPTFGDTMNLAQSNPNEVPVKQVIFGSLTWLPTDGAGVLYNAGFSFDEGIVGRIWTIAGASMEFGPDLLNLRSGGKWVTARIEVENNRAAEINTSSLRLSVDGASGSVPAVNHPIQLADADGDNNLDLKVKFDRTALAALLNQTSGSTAIVRASWLYTDGTEGTASTQIRLIR
jgi:hypothetical protein